MDSLDVRLESDERKRSSSQATRQQVFHASVCEQQHRTTHFDQYNQNRLQTNSNHQEKIYQESHNNRMRPSQSNIQPQNFKASRGSFANLNGHRKSDDRNFGDDQQEFENNAFSIVYLKPEASRGAERETCRSGDDRVVVVINRAGGSSCSTNNSNNLSIECSTNGSLKSTCDSSASSGFSSSCSFSAEAGGKNWRQKSHNHNNHGQRLPNSNDLARKQDSCYSGNVYTADPLGSLRKQLGLRSKVIDDLDRLLVEADKSRRSLAAVSSASESQLADLEPNRSSSRQTFVAGDSTLTRAHEIDYSTLCRDDFSSFISGRSGQAAGRSPEEERAFAGSSPGEDYETQQHAPSRQLLSGQKFESERDRKCSSSPNKLPESSGPTLIGLHDSDYNYSPDSTNNFDEEEAETLEELELGSLEAQEVILGSPSSSRSSLSSPKDAARAASQNEDNQSSIDKELLLIESQSLCQLAPESSSPLSKPQERPEELPSLADSSGYRLSDAILESYLNRIQALLRLSRGDTSVSMREAFGGSSDELSKMSLSEELKVETEFSEGKQNGGGTRVVQEIQMSDNSILRNVITKDFLDILLAPQTSAPLDWHKAEPVQDEELRMLTKQEVRLLEESLLSRFQGEPELRRESLVRAVRTHVASFVESYTAYRKCPKLRQELRALVAGRGWHGNWLFASKRSYSSSETSTTGSSVKRWKMSPEVGESCNIELLNYATLLQHSKRPGRFRGSTDWRRSKELNEEDRTSALLESVYQAQEERPRELYELALASSGQPDVCRILPHELNDGDDCEDTLDRKKAHVRSLSIRYDSSSLVRSLSNRRDKYIFSSYGYLFTCPSLPSNVDKRLAARVEERLLEKLLQLTVSSSKLAQSNLELRRLSFESERAKFVIEPTSVELMSELKVVQICCKISGSLPIIVRWFRMSEEEEEEETLSVEISDTKSGSNKIRLREATELRAKSSAMRSKWPIEMCASYDYEYQTQASSWFRFRRNGSDIMFEIRDGSFEFDYNQTYKCVIENYCSREGKSFRLSSRKRLSELLAGQVGRLKNAAQVGSRSSARAILRTWSQRTLHKPKPLTIEPPAELGRQLRRSGESEELSLRLAQGKSVDSSSKSVRLKSGGHLLISRDARASFGKEFPYHPENLIKRLEENKFSSLSNYRTLTRSTRVTSNAVNAEEHFQPIQQISGLRSQSARAEHGSAFISENFSQLEKDAEFKSSFAAISGGDKEPGEESSREGKENLATFRAVSMTKMTATETPIVSAPKTADVNGGKFAYKQRDPSQPRLPGS